MTFVVESFVPVGRTSGIVTVNIAKFCKFLRILRACGTFVLLPKCEKFSTFSKRLNFLKLELALIGDHLSLGSCEEFFFVTVVKSLLQISIASLAVFR